MKVINNKSKSDKAISILAFGFFSALQFLSTKSASASSVPSCCCCCC